MYMPKSTISAYERDVVDLKWESLRKLQKHCILQLGI